MSTLPALVSVCIVAWCEALTFSLRSQKLEGSVLAQRVMWVHVSKSSGSSICKAAHENGEHVIAPACNCNYWEVDRARDMNKTRDHISCRDRVELFRSHGVTWAQIEREVNENDLCEDIDYGIMIRDPKGLALSFANYEADKFGRSNLNADIVSRHLNCVVSKGKGGTCDGLAAFNGEHIQAPLYMFFDNYLVRVLGGIDTYRLPVGGVTKQHLNLVMQRLASFKKVLVSDDFKKDRFWLDAFNWTTAPKRERESSHTLVFSQEQLELMDKTMSHDLQIWNMFSNMDFESRVKPWRTWPTHVLASFDEVEDQCVGAP